MELKMATTGTLTSLQFLLNQVAHKLVYKGSTHHFYSSPMMVTGFYFSNSIFHFAREQECFITFNIQM